MDPATIAMLVSGGSKILGAAFGGKGNTKMDSPREQILSQAQGAREAGAKWGFNPLTMLQYGQTGGNYGGGAPPLASTDLLMGAVSDMTDALSGEASRRAAANQLEYDLGKLKLETLRASAQVDTTPPALGGRTGTVPGPSSWPMSDPFNPFPALTGISNGPPILTSTLPRNPLLDPVKVEPGIDGGIAIPEPRLDRGVGAFIGGFHLESTPGWSPGQVIEDEYGDAVSWVYGAAKAASDVGTTIGSWAAKSPNSPFQKPKYRTNP